MASHDCTPGICLAWLPGQASFQQDWVFIVSAPFEFASSELYAAKWFYIR